MFFYKRKMKIKTYQQNWSTKSCDFDGCKSIFRCVTSSIYTLKEYFHVFVALLFPFIKIRPGTYNILSSISKIKVNLEFISKSFQIYILIIL